MHAAGNSHLKTVKHLPRLARNLISGARDWSFPIIKVLFIRRHRIITKQWCNACGRNMLIREPRASDKLSSNFSVISMACPSGSSRAHPKRIEWTSVNWCTRRTVYLELLSMPCTHVQYSQSLARPNTPREVGGQTPAAQSSLRFGRTNIFLVLSFCTISANLTNSVDHCFHPGKFRKCVLASIAFRTQTLAGAAGAPRKLSEVRIAERHRAPFTTRKTEIMVCSFSHIWPQARVDYGVRVK